MTAAIPGDLCFLCGDQLRRGEGRVHPDCLTEWQNQINARTCFMCGEALPAEFVDYAIHPDCQDRTT